MKLFVGCSSYNDIPSMYIDDCKNLLREIFKRDYDLVFGACNDGLMGLSYKIACSNNKDVLGIFPVKYKSEAEEIQGLKEMVNSVSERTDKIIDKSDILLFLPGGIGTMYELLTSIESKRGDEHNKTIVIYNSCGYYNKFLDYLNFMLEEGFVSKDSFKYFSVCNNLDDIINLFDEYENNESV